MSAATFESLAFGNTPDEAFIKAVEDAAYLHGHGGYTGTIAEKDCFTVIPANEHLNTQKRLYARFPIADEDERIDDKWGPAGAINCTGTNDATRYRERNGLVGTHGDVRLFFGWASQ